MKRLALTCVSLLATALFDCGEAHAQARSTISRAPRAEVQAAPPAGPAAQSSNRRELEVWLTRLVGRYQVKGTVMQRLNDGRPGTRGISGDMECAGIGDGPGVHCLIKASWPPLVYLSISADRMPGGAGPLTPTLSQMYNTLNPAVLLLSLDPDDLKIKALLVDDHSIADDLSGALTGDTVELVSGRKGCWGPLTAPRCPWGLGITAKPGSKVIRVQTSWRNDGALIEFQLHRKSAGAAVAPGALK